MEANTKKKGAPPPRYDEAFKAGAVQMVTEQGREPKEVAKDLGICIDTLRTWMKTAGIQLGQVSRANREQQRIRELAAEIRAMRKQLSEKDEIVDILKKVRRHPVETIVEKYRCVQTLHRQGTTAEQACRILAVSRSGYYGWANRTSRGREWSDQALRRKLTELHQKYPTLGLDSLYVDRKCDVTRNLCKYDAVLCKSNHGIPL